MLQHQISRKKIEIQRYRSTQDHQQNNMAFHSAIADLSGNPLIKLIVHSLLDLLNKVRPHAIQSSKFIKDTCKRHEAISKSNALILVLNF